MKKLLFAFAMFVAVSFASCGNSSKSVDTVDSTLIDTVQLDSMVSDTVDTIA